MTGFEDWLRANPIEAVLVSIVLTLLATAAGQVIGGGGFVVGWLLQGAGMVMLATFLMSRLRGRGR